MFCKICNKESKTLKSLSEHIHRYHKDISIETYYLKFMNTLSSITCSICNAGKRKFISLTKGFTETCCSEGCSNKLRSLKRKELSIIKYGISNPGNTESARNKAKSTCLEKWGKENPSQVPEIHQKKVSTCKSNYGTEYPLQSAVVQKSMVENCLKTTGYTHPSKNPSIKKQIQDKMVETTGYKSNFHNPVIQRKVDEVFTLNLGVRRPLCSDTIKGKCRETFSSKNNGVQFPFQLEEYRDKANNTIVDRYFSTEDGKQLFYAKAKKGMLDNHGVDNAGKMVGHIDKVKSTNMDKYGSDFFTQSEKYEKGVCGYIEEHRKSCLKLFGTANYTQSEDYRKRIPEIQKKIYTTKKKNNTFKVSACEEFVYKVLVKNFKSVKRQYTDIRYPYSCDFYIEDIDMFIEVQGNWTHGFKSFNPKDSLDIEVLKYWESKSTTNKYYNQAIKVWTKSDVQKRELARNNKLKFLELFEYSSEQSILVQIRRVLQGLKYTYYIENMLTELELLSTKPGEFTKDPVNNKIILTYQDSFYKEENRIYMEDPVLRRYLIENRIKYLDKSELELSDKDLLRGFKISGIYRSYSHFSPFWIKAFIEKYDIKSIYDPCGGWGHRLLGSKDIHYIYNDIDISKSKSCSKIITDFNLKNKVVYSQDCTKFTPSEDYECVFTCPPYFNTEKYSSNEGDSIVRYPIYDTWLNIWWKETIIKSLKNGVKYFAFVINKKYKEDMLQVCLKCNLKFKEEISLGGNRRDHFQRKGSICNKGEILLVLEV